MLRFFLVLLPSLNRIRFFPALLVLLLCPTEQWASHKPVSKAVILYIVTEMFKDAGGLKAFSMILQVDANARSDEDLDLILKVAGYDGEKIALALEGVSASTHLFNGGFAPESAVRITKAIQRSRPETKGAIQILTLYLKRRGQEVDSTQVSEALRQGELLKHMGIDPHPAFEKNGINLNVLDLRNREDYRNDKVLGLDN